MRPVGVVVGIVNQPIARRSPIATGDSAKNHTEAIFRSSGNDLMISVAIARLGNDPVWGLIDDSHRDVGSGPV